MDAERAARGASGCISSEIKMLYYGRISICMLFGATFCLMTCESDEDDGQSSLFGSPGPSRSPSPALVLPGIIQNVGTIALPGSQLYSELPKDPLALSFKSSRPTTQVSCSPDVLQKTTAAPSPTLSTPLSGSSTPSARSRASSSAPPAIGPKKRKRTRKKAQPPSPAPSIALPDPSAPLPPHFLRNQMALLGTAGLVAGIKPASLSTQRNTSRGCTPANPIIVDGDARLSAKSNISAAGRSVRFDQHDAPRLGKQFGSVPPSSDIDPALLPAPTNKEIVAMLIGQKDIFPVLQCILRLIAGQKAEQLALASAAPARKRRKSKSEQPAPPPVPNGPKAPPLKRRRLNRVPAGAADWDVPYPFQEGEGPQEYRKMWEKERGKQLISQLMNLIRIAARKAATKKYHQQEPRRQVKAKAGTVQLERSQSMPVSLKEAGQSQVSEQLSSGALPASQQPLEVSTPVTPVPDMSTRLSSTAMPSKSISDTSFDQLISWLLAASPVDGVAGFRDNSIYGAGTGTPTEPSAAFVNSNVGEDVNDGLIDSWLNVFETFPMPSDGFASALDTSSAQYQNQNPTTSASTPAPETPAFNFLDMTPSFDFNFDLHPAHIHSAEHINTANTPLSSENALQHDAEQFMRDIGFEPVPAPQYHTIQSQTVDAVIDPTLLAISQPQPRPLVDMDKISNITPSDQTLVPETGGSPVPSAPSPMRSASLVSSVGDADPSTPASALWESSTPDIVAAQGSQDPFASQGMLRRALWNQYVSRAHGGVIGEYRQEHEDDEVTEVRRFTAQEKGKEKISEQMEVVEEDNQPERVPATTPPGVSPLPSQNASRPAQNKQEIMQRAQERRKQLVEELERIKMQLWETTIEQSVLVELQKEILP